MSRSTFCLSLVLLCTLIFSYESALGQDTLRIRIEKVAHNPQLRNRPEIFDVEGTVTIPSEIRKRGSFVILSYTESESGGKIQLQMKGTAADGTQLPNSKELVFDKPLSTISWRMRIWLGTKDEFDPSYTVYAVIVRTFIDEEGKSLINVTHDQYTKFKDVLDILRQKGFNPLIWTVKKEVERFE